MTRLLQFSLALNLLLAGLVLWRHSRPAPMPRPPRGAIGEPASRNGARITRITSTAGTPATPWAGLDSRDLRQLMANLRAIGCPESTIRDLVVFRVCREHRARLLAWEEETARSWDLTRIRDPGDWRDSQRRNGEIRDQMQSELEDLLGGDFADYRMSVLGWQSAAGPDYLPLAKRKQVRELETQHRWAAWELTSARMSGQLDREGAAQLAAMEREQREALARLLSPQEFAEYLVRESPAARYVLTRVPTARSEAEFRAIVRLADELGLDPNVGNDAASRFGQEPLDTNLAKADSARLAEFDRRLKGLLGEERVAEQAAEQQAAAEREREREQQRQEEQERARLTALAESVGVSAEEADQFMVRIKAQQAELQVRFTELEQTLTGTPEERKRQMEAVVMAELEQQAVEVMGEKGRDFVKRLGGGSHEP